MAAIMTKTFENTCNGSGGDYYKLYIKVDVVSQDIANNTSKVEVTMYGQSTNDSYGAYNNGGGCSYSLTVDGKVRASSSSASMDFRNKARVPMGSWTGNIAHNANGTKALSVSGSFSFSGSSYLSGGSCSGSLTLPTIGRASSISIASKTVTLGVADKITVKAASSAFKHTVTYSFKATNGNTITKTLQKDWTGNTSLTYNWTPSLNDYASNITNSQTASGTLICYTYNGTTLIGSTTVSNVVLKVPVNGTAPTFDKIDITDVGTKDCLTQFDTFVRGMSRPKYSVKFSGKYGATVKSFKMTIDGNSYNAANIDPSAGTASITTYVIDTYGPVEYTMTLTDSRGVTTTRTGTSNFAYYRSPSFMESTGERQTADNTKADLTVKIDGSEISTSKPNKATVTYQYKKISDKSYSNKTTIISAQALTSVLTKKVTISNLDANIAYDILVTITDTAGSTVTKTILIPTEFAVMDFYKDGTGVGFGRVAAKPNVMAINMDMAVSEAGASTADGVDGVYINREGRISIRASSISPYIAFTDKDGNFASISLDNRYITVNDVKLYHKYGDTITLTGTVGGSVTNSKKSVLFKIPFGKPISDATEASITSLKLTVRQNGNYIVGSASAGAVVTGYTGTLSRNDCSINTAYVASEALPNSINNAPCGVSYEATIKFS